jgi:hypothetical protein
MKKNQKLNFTLEKMKNNFNFFQSFDGKYLYKSIMVICMTLVVVFVMFTLFFFYYHKEIINLIKIIDKYLL